MSAFQFRRRADVVSPAGRDSHRLGGIASVNGAGRSGGRRVNYRNSGGRSPRCAMKDEMPASDYIFRQPMAEYEII